MCQYECPLKDLITEKKNYMKTLLYLTSIYCRDLCGYMRVRGCGRNSWNSWDMCFCEKQIYTAPTIINVLKIKYIRNAEHISTCFKAFLLCFWEGEMSLLVGTEGEEHRGCGDDGCDCNLEGTMKYKSTPQMLQNPLPEGGVQTLSHHAFVLMKLKPLLCTKKQITLHC